MSELTLHVWPGRWDLPSVDPGCIAAVLYLQLAFPGKYALVASTNPDESPSGQLPFLTHEHRAVSLAGPIGKYAASLKTSDGTVDLDASLSAIEKAQRTAWVSHVDHHMWDLTAHMLFSLRENWIQTTHPAYISMLSVPQRYYLPSRLRATVRPRLQATGLWDLPGIEQKEEEEGEDESGSKFRDDRVKPKQPDPKAKFAEVFEREKVLEKARSVLDLYVRLLGNKRFFYQNRPTMLDIALASHTLILIKAPFVDTLLQTLLLESYPTLVKHAYLVESHALSTLLPTPSSPKPFSLGSFVPWAGRRSTGVSLEPERHVPAEDKEFVAMRWAWIAAAVAGTVFYLFQSGVRISYGESQVEEDEVKEG